MNAYLKGVEIGLQYVRLYFFVTAVLLTAYFTSWQIALGGSSASVFDALMVVVSMIGMGISGLLSFLLGGYEKQLSNCISRACEIEDTWGGDLSNSIAGTSNRKMDSVRSLRWLFGFFIFVWLVAGLFSKPVLELLLG